MAVLERDVRALEQEQRKTRDRLHKIEPAQRTLLELIKQNKAQFENGQRQLAGELDRIRKDLPGLVREGISGVLETRGRERREGLSLRAQLVAVGFGVAGTVTAIIEGLLR